MNFFVVAMIKRFFHKGTRGAVTERANKIPKKRKDYTDQDTDANSQSVRMKKESIIKKN